MNFFVFYKGSFAVIVLAMMGKMAITSSYGTVYVFSAEQFPTVIRNVGIGASSTFARVGGILAPFVNITVCKLYNILKFLSELKKKTVINLCSLAYKHATFTPNFINVNVFGLCRLRRFR